MNQTCPNCKKERHYSKALAMWVCACDPKYWGSVTSPQYLNEIFPGLKEKDTEKP